MLFPHVLVHEQQNEWCEKSHVAFENRPVACAHIGVKGGCHLGKAYTLLGRCSVRMSVVSLRHEKLVVVAPVFH